MEGGFTSCLTAFPEEPAPCPGQRVRAEGAMEVVKWKWVVGERESSERSGEDSGCGSGGGEGGANLPSSIPFLRKALCPLQRPPRRRTDGAQQEQEGMPNDLRGLTGKKKSPKAPGGHEHFSTCGKRVTAERGDPEKSEILFAAMSSRRSLLLFAGVSVVAVALLTIPSVKRELSEALAAFLRGEDDRKERGEIRALRRRFARLNNVRFCKRVPKSQRTPRCCPFDTPRFKPLFPSHPSAQALAKKQKELSEAMAEAQRLLADMSRSQRSPAPSPSSGSRGPGTPLSNSWVVIPPTQEQREGAYSRGGSSSSGGSCGVIKSVARLHLLGC